MRNVSEKVRQQRRMAFTPSEEERRELGITPRMCRTIFNNLNEVVDRRLAEWLAQNS